jgi:2-C-methyl-D-erythritol 4-phosphate cytidylyltransferase
MAGLDIVMTDGDENNFKITTKADLDRFTDIVKSWEI